MEARLHYFRNDYNTDYTGKNYSAHAEFGRIAEKNIQKKLSSLNKDPELYFYSQQRAQAYHSKEPEHQAKEPEHQAAKVDPHTGTVYTHSGGGNYINTETGSLNVNQGVNQYFDIQTGKFKELQ